MKPRQQTLMKPTRKCCEQKRKWIIHIKC